MKKINIFILTAVLCSSCGLYSKYTRPASIKGENLYGEGVAENADSSSLASLSYRQLFTDPKLQNLISVALQRNSDIKSLEYAVQQAQAGYKASKLAFVPGFTFAPQGGYNISETSHGWGYAITIAMDWEIDLFGKLLNQKRKAGAALLMTEDIRDAAQSHIVATVASLYFQLLILDEQLSLADSTARKWQQTVDVMEKMKVAGMMNEASVSQTRATCFAIQAGMLDIQKAIREVENAMCLILKQTPQKIDRSTMSEQVLPQELKVGVSAQLLSNRPDVRQAEHNLEQYFYGVQHARSMFYPSLKIDASAAYAGLFIPSLIGSLVQPIFAHGGIKANYDISKAQYEQALLEFEQTMLEAGADVNNALIKCQTAREKSTIHAEQTKFLTKAMRNTQALMIDGSRTYLEVIYAQQALLEAQNDLLNDKLEEAQGVVELYLALGGGVKL